MTPNGLDDLIRTNFPARDVGPAQVQRVMDAVMTRLDQPQPTTGWRRLLDLLSELTPSPPVLLRQSVVPVGIALALGLYVGQHLHQPAPNPTLSALLPSSSSLLLAGY
ncbi:MAG: hypothetical protein FD176_2082 [Rhodospirillaceae bacterium]|nr:MAG: hypothetical protein FD176_2082 [Rhodospirillaceae bacterium]TNC96437.1 MAG: Uncharacterized protein FD119_1744 [Stygiobacter sp.]